MAILKRLAQPGFAEDSVLGKGLLDVCINSLELTSITAINGNSSLEINLRYPRSCYGHIMVRAREVKRETLARLGSIFHVWWSPGIS